MGKTPVDAQKKALPWLRMHGFYVFFRPLLKAVKVLAGKAVHETEQPSVSKGLGQSIEGSAVRRTLDEVVKTALGVPAVVVVAGKAVTLERIERPGDVVPGKRLDEGIIFGFFFTMVLLELEDPVQKRRPDVPGVIRQDEFALGARNPRPPDVRLHHHQLPLGKRLRLVHQEVHVLFPDHRVNVGWRLSVTKGDDRAIRNAKLLVTNMIPGAHVWILRQERVNVVFPNQIVSASENTSTATRIGKPARQYHITRPC